MFSNLGQLRSDRNLQDAERASFRLTLEEMDEFQELVQITTGECMTREEASFRANALLTLARVIIGPLPEDESERAVLTSSVLPDSARHPTLNV
jgi:hypothetical protein